MKEKNYYNVNKAHQRIIREKRETEEKRETLFGDYWNELNLSSNNAIIKEINRDTAKPLILRYEWLGTLPANYMKYVGLFFDGYLAGVCCFTNVKFGGKYTIFNYEAFCLGRGACVHWSPKWAGSFLVANSCKLLFGKQKPIILVAYSDWSAGEIGTIYQACNWYYLGHKGTKEWIDKNGKRYDINTPSVRAVTGFMRKNNPDLKATKEMIEIEINKMKDEGYKLVNGTTRGRYAYVYGKNCKEKKEMIKTLKKHSKPYPKRIIN